MNSSSNALNLLSVYNNSGSDSDSENEIPGPKVSVKRCFREDETPDYQIKQTKRLPVPALLHPEISKTTNENELEQKEKHGGRIRSFPHERGNWNTYVFVPCELNEVFDELISDIIGKCNKITNCSRTDDLHISLTRTVILRHHWIDSFIQTLNEQLHNVTEFICFFDKLQVYYNDERTRTFIGLEIQTGNDSLRNIVHLLDKCLKEFRLPEFYKNPSFHMSLIWCVGDFEEPFRDLINDLNAILHDYVMNYPQQYWYLRVRNLICKTGNKQFNLPLCKTIQNF